MVDDREDFLLTLHVVDLLQLNYCALFQAFQGHRIRLFATFTAMFDESDPSESTRSERRQDVEIVQEELACGLAAHSVLHLCLCLIVVHYAREG